MKKILAFAILFVALLFTPQFGTLQPAHAAIECNNQFQVIRDHGEISTPYCQISYLTEVSREFGYDYSFREVRKSFFIKQEICDHIGNDIRIDGICRAFKSDQGSDKFD